MALTKITHIVWISVALALCGGAALGACNDAPAPKVNWYGCDLSARDLSGMDLRGAILSNTAMQGTVLAAAVLTGADFENANAAAADSGPRYGRDRE